MILFSFFLETIKRIYCAKIVMGFGYNKSDVV